MSLVVPTFKRKTGKKSEMEWPERRKGGRESCPRRHGGSSTVESMGDNIKFFQTLSVKSDSCTLNIVTGRY